MEDKQLRIRASEKFRKALKAYAKKYHTNESAVVRQAVTIYISENDPIIKEMLKDV